MDRQPAVAGRFYDANPERMNGFIDGALSQAVDKQSRPTILAMAPHAGYVFSGGVCGKTLAAANLASTVLMLGPNHTGMGERFAVWSDGAWNIPGAKVPVDEPLAETLLEASPLLTPDRAAHVQEHSLEVIIPFLHRLNPKTTIVPIAVSSHVPADLESVGKAIGQTLAAYDRPVSIVVSSDMSHFISHEDAKRIDALALEAAVALDPKGLFDTVSAHQISMCGVLPMTLGLYAALEMSATKGELIAYATSGEVSGDFDQVVGYAGIVVS